MTLARSLPDNATEWWLYLGVLALYLLTRWFLAWRQARKEAAEHPYAQPSTTRSPERRIPDQRPPWERSTPTGNSWALRRARS